MTIWALSDPHLALSTPDKDMSFFGPAWEGYTEKIEKQWRALVSNDDLVLVPGDISWAMKLEQALIDLEWIDRLPGKKIILKGNHDYWWPSSKKLREALPPSIDFIHNNAITWNDVTIGGARLWDTAEYSFNEFIEFQENPKERKEEKPSLEESEKLFAKELERLKVSLEQLDHGATRRIAITHYPPVGADLAPSKASAILESFDIEVCIFGHLHNVRPGSLPFGEARGVRYLFASCDYIDFTPIKIESR